MDPAWPVLPSGWVLGEVTSVSVDSEDNVWVLHVPQSIPEAQRIKGRQAIEQTLAAARRLLQSLQNAAESEKLR